MVKLLKRIKHHVGYWFRVVFMRSVPTTLILTRETGLMLVLDQRGRLMPYFSGPVAIGYAEGKLDAIEKTLCNVYIPNSDGCECIEGTMGSFHFVGKMLDGGTGTLHTLN